MTTAANAEQAEHWNSEESTHWVDSDERYNSILRPFSAHLLDAAAIHSGQQVLDVGCGCGDTTRAAAGHARPGEALGLDLSGPMLAHARRLAEDEDVDNVRFEQADAQVHRFDAGAFDVAISRFGLMFFDDAVAAFANIRSALRPGGRLAFVCWRSIMDNEWLMVPVTAALEHLPMPDLGDDPTAPGPFSLAEPDRIRTVLTEAGYKDLQLDPLDERISYGRDAADTVAFMRGTGLGREFLDKAPPEAATAAIDAIERALATHQTDDGIVLASAAWLVQSRA